MGKKAKVGKQRKDKFYFLAKEAGFRSRAAFKLLQLNKRFEFLQKSRALVDLCAAPGGWLQVAEQNMPVSSLRIGVDLVPIKPIKNCITLQGDIIEEKTRHAVRKELNTWEADCVLHDGAPNVGTNWGHDAFQQNCLVLSAFRLATQILRRGGYFITKIFRSADSQMLISVFEKLFKKVNHWKPAASRLESAESFVVCEKYLKPDKVDSELLDAKKVFSSQNGQTENVNLQRLLLHPRRKDKKPKALGYEDNTEISQHKELPVSEFLSSKNSLQILAKASALVLDSEKDANSKHTTEEIRECLSDLKVCGPAEIKRILTWRKKLIEEQKLAKKKEKQAEEIIEKDPLVNEIEEIEEEQSQDMKELEEIDELIRNAQAEEKSQLKKRKKKLLKEKQKLNERRKLNMIHDGDEPTIGEDFEIFSLKTIQKAVMKAKSRALAAAEAVSNGKNIMLNSDSEDEEKEENGENVSTDDEDLSDEPDAHNVTENNKKQFTNMENDQKNDEEIPSENEWDDDDKMENYDNEENGNNEKSIQKKKLTPLQLAIGEQMIYSKKRSRDIEDWAWNRHTNNDEELPDWFLADEKRHNRPTELPPSVDFSRVQFYAQRDPPVNARSVKKVAEAKMRKKKRQQRRLDKAKKRAEGILENEQMEHVEKVRELKKLYKKAARPEKKEVKYQVVTKGKRGKMTRPKGPFKLVDRRLKKDNRPLKNQKSKKNGRNGKSGSKRNGGGKRPSMRTGGGGPNKKRRN
uniref:Putative rRNA methyltransferase n=1 Tax=Meloidogyne hapla TaxID=6305 RepID=A0A1I8B544_MELHA